MRARGICLSVSKLISISILQLLPPKEGQMTEFPHFSCGWIIFRSVYLMLLQRIPNWILYFAMGNDAVINMQWPKSLGHSLGFFSKDPRRANWILRWLTVSMLSDTVLFTYSHPHWRWILQPSSAGIQFLLGCFPTDHQCVKTGVQLSRRDIDFHPWVRSFGKCLWSTCLLQTRPWAELEP